MPYHWIEKVGETVSRERNGNGHRTAPPRSPAFRRLTERLTDTQQDSDSRWETTPEQARVRTRAHMPGVTGPPVVLITLYDGQMNISMRYLYGALTGAGVLTKVIRFGHTVPYEHSLDYSLFQTMKVKFPLARPPVDEADVETLLRTVKELGPCWIGFNVIAPHNHVAARLTQRLREVVDCPIAWGGYMAINEPEWCLQHADVVCVGEGERVVVELTEAIRNGSRDFSRIAGVWYRDAAGAVHRNERRCLLQAEDLEQLPMVFFERTDDEILIPSDSLEWYVKQDRCDGGKSNSATIVHDVLFTRGCFFTCTFCFHNVHIGREKGNGRYYRPVSPAWVIDYLKDGKHRLKKTRFLFWEDIFPYDEEWVAEFARLYKKEIGLPFSVNFHPKLVREENVRLLADAGMDSCNMGFQSGSEAIRHRIFGRNETNEEILRSSEILNRYAYTCYDTIIDNPWETVEDLRQSLDLYMQFKPRFVVDTNTLLYFRNQQITTLGLADGKINEGDVLGARDIPGYQDVTCTPSQRRERSECRALMMLIVATQYEFIPRAQIRRWSETRELLEDDRRMARELLSVLYQHARRMRFEYADKANQFLRRRAEGAAK